MHEDETLHFHHQSYSKMTGNAPSKLRFVRYGFMVSTLFFSDLMDMADDRHPMLSSSSPFLYSRSLEQGV